MAKWREKAKEYAMSMYLIMLLLMVSIVVYLAVSGKAPDRNEPAYEQFDREIVWYDEEGRIVESPDSLVSLGAENHAIYTVIPENLPENVSLCFRNKHVLFSAYVGEDCVYEQSLPESRFYTNSVGANWVMIPLKQSYAGQRLYVYYELCYEEGGVGFDRMAIGADREYMLHLLREKTLSLVLPFIYLIIGFILILLDILIYRYTQERHNLLYLGCLAVMGACYCLAETQVFPLFISNQRIMHLLAMFALNAVSIPIVIYADALFSFQYRRTPLVFSAISLGAFLVATVLNFLNIMDYHETMLLPQILLLTSIGMMIYAMAGYVIRVRRAGEKFMPYNHFIIIGISAIALCGVVDIVRFWMKLNQEPGMYVRIGFLLFLICFSIASSWQIIDAFKTSTQTALISRLAYEDGLTGLKNRTSYNEALEEIESEHRDVGVVMMDVNDLKEVNDSEGHDAGDKMLIHTAKIIQEAFPENGMVCYRIGGDEFVVLVQTEHIREDCEKGIQRLEMLCRKFNATGACPFRIVIAAGYQIYDHNKLDGLEDVVRVADGMMYADKRRLKANK